MIRLRDFAARQGVSERTLQNHIKNNAEALEGHIDRRGNNGTWLDDEAVKLLQAKIMRVTVDLAEPSEEIRRLQEDNRKLLMALADAEHRAGENAKTAGLLSAATGENERLREQVDRLNVANGSLRAQNDVLSAENVEQGKNLAAALNDAQAAREEAAKAQSDIEAMKKASIWKRLRGWK